MQLIWDLNTLHVLCHSVERCSISLGVSTRYTLLNNVLTITAIVNVHWYVSGRQFYQSEVVSRWSKVPQFPRNKTCWGKVYSIQCVIIFRGCDTVGSAWIRLGSRAIWWKSITNIGHIHCKCELAFQSSICNNWIISAIVPLLCQFQCDTKGVPVIVLNQILKRHSLALRYIKRQLLPTRLLSSSQDSSGEEEENEQSMIGRKGSADVLVFEEGLPTSNFLSSWIYFASCIRVVMSLNYSMAINHFQCLSWYAKWNTSPLVSVMVSGGISTSS